MATTLLRITASGMLWSFYHSHPIFPAVSLRVESLVIAAGDQDARGQGQDLAYHGQGDWAHGA